MRLVYLIGIHFYAFAVRVASLWNPKAKKWVKGRQVVWDQLQAFERSNDVPTYWFHCASLGEFEQGRPLMERLKADQNCQLVITFFSPSGYEIRKDYDLADLIVYLPKENRKNVARFYQSIQPSKIFFIKYEFWATYIFHAKSLGIPIYSVAAVFRSNQLFFKFWGGYMRSVLRQFDAIFVQEKASKQLLSEINISAIVAGDTRYDRVMKNAKKVDSYPEIEKFINGNDVFLVGSSWAADEAVLFPLINHPDFSEKAIIAPHEIHASRIAAIENGLDQPSVRYSQLLEGEGENAKVLIIDNIGMLMNLYQYAKVAYIGGAFGTGLHNILEPACFGVPVIFGPDHQKFREASVFIENGIGQSVSNCEELFRAYEQFKSADQKATIQAFMQGRTGATSLVYSAVFD